LGGRRRVWDGKKENAACSFREDVLDTAWGEIIAWESIRHGREKNLKKS